MTVTQFGKRIGVPRTTAYRIVARGFIDWVDIGTGTKPRIRISESALLRYIRAREHEGWRTPSRPNANN